MSAPPGSARASHRGRPPLGAAALGLAPAGCGGGSGGEARTTGAAPLSEDVTSGAATPPSEAAAGPAQGMEVTVT